MLEVEKKVIAEEDIACSMTFSTQVGNGRQLVFAAGFPLDWELSRINNALDKLVSVSDRQALRYEAHDRRAAIANMYHQINVQLTQKDRFYKQLNEHWITGSRKGEFKLSQDNAAKLANYDVSVAGLRDAIFKAEKELQELEEKCR